jgi:hypothetical protein
MTTGASTALPAPPEAVPLAVELGGVTKRFGAVTAVDGVSLLIKPRRDRGAARHRLGNRTDAPGFRVLMEARR